MENKPDMTLFPQRIVCAANESVEILIRLGCADRVVGRPAQSTQAEVSRAADVGGFGATDIDAVIALGPDLVITYSDNQGALAGALAAECVTVLALNHLDIEGMYRSIALLGGVTGHAAQALALIEKTRAEIAAIAAKAPSRRPRVYFEEWHTPTVTATRWISEMVALAGGVDVFDDRSRRLHYMERQVQSADVIAADPEVIFVSWCGIPLDVEAVCSRPGWQNIAAVRHRRIYEVPARAVLQPGPRIVEGVAVMADIVRRVTSSGQPT